VKQTSRREVATSGFDPQQNPETDSIAGRMATARQKTDGPLGCLAPQVR